MIKLLALVVILFISGHSASPFWTEQYKVHSIGHIAEYYLATFMKTCTPNMSCFLEDHQKKIPSDIKEDAFKKKVEFFRSVSNDGSERFETKEPTKVLAYGIAKHYQDANQNTTITKGTVKNFANTPESV